MSVDMPPVPAWLSFRRIADVPFEACVGALDGSRSCLVFMAHHKHAWTAEREPAWEPPGVNDLPRRADRHGQEHGHHPSPRTHPDDAERVTGIYRSEGMTLRTSGIGRPLTRMSLSRAGPAASTSRTDSWWPLHTPGWAL
jgi:hypothetical protein